MSEAGAKWFTDREQHIDSLMQILRDETTSIRMPRENPASKAVIRKEIRNNGIYIIKDGKAYSPDGRRIR